MEIEKLEKFCVLLVFELFFKIVGLGWVGSVVLEIVCFFFVFCWKWFVFC